MLKSKLKVLLFISLIIILISSFCFATTEPEVSLTETSGDASQETPDAAQDNAPAVATTNEEIEWISGDLYKIDNTINITGVVDGNVYIIGKDVTISGEVGGDIFVIANNLTLNGGYVYNNIFAMAETITINGVVYNLYATANTINIDTNGFIYRDINAMAENINVSGVIKRNAFLGVSNLKFIEDSNTHIGGNLEYSSNAEATIPEGAVAGEVKYEQQTESAPKSRSVLSYIVDLIKTLLLTFVLVMILFWIAPNFVNKIKNTNVNKAFTSLGIGLLSPICLVIAGVILILTIIGMPIFICTIFAYIVLTYIGSAVTSLFFGNLIAKKLKMEGKMNLVLFTLLSCFIIWLISLIPFIGWLVSFLAYMFGIGLTLVNIFWKKEDKKSESNVSENN